MTNTENFIQKLRHLTLTKTEAQDMRERLIAYTEMHNVVEVRRTAPTLSYFSRVQVTFSRPLIAGGLILVILVSGTGVSFAAQNSLPGEPLYAVKVSVVEPIQGALITAPVAKAQWENELTNRRLAEASTLAAQNNLGTSTQQYLAQAVQQHIALAQEDANQLSASGNESAALTVRSDLEAKLSAHVELLSLINPQLVASGDASTTVVAVAELLHSVDAERNGVQLSRKATEMALGATANASSARDSASTTPAEAKVIAFVDSQSTARVSEENKILRSSSALFGFLPPTEFGSSTDASTTASTTIISAASSTESTPSAKRFPLYRLRFEH